jgi:hypothetical protein
MFCVEVKERRIGDLGVTIIVLSRSQLEARTEVCRLYPEYVERGTLEACIREVRHIHCDWDAGRVLVAKNPIRLRLG